jgi:hypothetical protein
VTQLAPHLPAFPTGGTAKAGATWAAVCARIESKERERRPGGGANAHRRAIEAACLKQFCETLMLELDALPPSPADPVAVDAGGRDDGEATSD